MCKKHQEAYDRGDKLKAFYGKTVQKKESKSEIKKPVPVTLAGQK